MILEKVFSSPSSSQYTRRTPALEDTGRPMLAPWMSSRTLLTLRFAVLSPITKLMASIKLDFPEPLGPIIQLNLLKGPMIFRPRHDLKSSSTRRWRKPITAAATARNAGYPRQTSAAVEHGDVTRLLRLLPRQRACVSSVTGSLQLLATESWFPRKRDAERSGGAMYEQDRAEAAALQRRRNAEQQRQSRVFDTTVRTIGVDVEALDSQVHDKKIQKEIENKRQEAFDTQMVQNDQILCLLDQRQKDDVRNLNAAINEFRLQYQKKEDRREYDLYDPLALKKDLPPRVSDDDPRCTVSGVQRLMGEDLTERDRKREQQVQLREWSLQQQYEWAKASEDQRSAENLYDKMRVELDKKALELQKMEEQAKREICIFTKAFNRAQAEESLERKKVQKQLEEEENSVEIYNHTNGDLLSEDPAQATSAFGPHRVAPDRWKGMSPEQLKEVTGVQQQQIQEKMRIKEEERQRQAEWDRRRVQEARAMVLLERQQKREERELRKAQDHINLQLEQAHKAQKNYLDQEVFSNTPTDEYFEQFNTTSR